MDRLAAVSAASIRRGVGAIGLGQDALTGQWRVALSDGQVLAADAVCLALPSYQAARLVREFDEPLAHALEGIAYASWVTVNLAVRRCGRWWVFAARRSSARCIDRPGRFRSTTSGT